MASFQNQKKYIVVDDLVLELKYETNKPYRMGTLVPPKPQIYIANLHHGHSKTENFWGDKIKNSKKIKTQSEKGMGIKLLAWSVINIKKIFPYHSIDPEYWSGNFETGYKFWSNTTLWEKLTNKTYIDNERMKEWAESIEPIEYETSIHIYESLNFLGGGTKQKRKKTIVHNKSVKKLNKKRNLPRKKSIRRKSIRRKSIRRKYKFYS